MTSDGRFRTFRAFLLFNLLILNEKNTSGDVVSKRSKFQTGTLLTRLAKFRRVCTQFDANFVTGTVTVLFHLTASPDFAFILGFNNNYDYQQGVDGEEEEALKICITNTVRPKIIIMDNFQINPVPKSYKMRPFFVSLQ